MPIMTIASTVASTTEFTGVWNLSLILETASGRTRSNDMANKHLEKIRIPQGTNIITGSIPIPTAMIVVSTILFVAKP